MNVAANYSLQDYFDNKLGSRVIGMPLGQEQAHAYAAALEARLPVFSAYSDISANRLLLLLPSGTRSVVRSERFIARDIENYKEIFTQIGQTLRAISEAGFGTIGKDENGSVLSAFAFSPQAKTKYGGEVFLLPPYRFQVHESNETTLEIIHDELRHSGQLEQYAITGLYNAVEAGMSHYGEV